MKIYLEVLIPIILLFISLVWYLWNAWSRKRLLKKYNPEKDLGKLAEDKRNKEWNHDGKKTKEGGEQNAKVGREKPINGTAIESDDRPEQPKGRALLSATEVTDDGKTSISNRKNGFGIRKLLRR